MHIIIPMSGVGQRFVDAGYSDPKPLISIDGKAIIEHVCSLFPGEDKFTFICNSMHLEETNMRAILMGIKPHANIVEIPPHKKGPVYAVTCIQDLIDDEDEVIVNYCDFGTYWDYNDFLKHTRERKADGAIPAYKRFHPHMLGTTNYAFMRDDKQWMLEIKEKEPFTDNRMNEYASNGTYYFRKGAFVKKYFHELIEKDINLNGEFYVSLVYNLLKVDDLQVSIYDVQHMLQWGTPQDLEEYNMWSKYFNHVIQEDQEVNVLKEATTLIPLAGRGSRFAREGYTVPKPLIPVSGKPMIIQACNSLPKTENYVFVTLEKHLRNYPLEGALTSEYQDCSVVNINEVTEGQAITCSLGLKDVDENQPLLISATDNGMIFNQEKFDQLVNYEEVDAVIFTFRNHVSSKNNPEMYGWVKIDGETATGVSVKVPISEDPFNDHAIVGSFYFKKVEYFNIALENLLKKSVRVNGEYYVDSLMGELIESGYNVKIFEVDDYIGWGTPNDYETFVYWQSYFHKDPNHAYQLEKDPTVNKEELNNLKNKYQAFEQEYR